MEVLDSCASCGAMTELDTNNLTKIKQEFYSFEKAKYDLKKINRTIPKIRVEGGGYKCSKCNTEHMIEVGESKEISSKTIPLDPQDLEYISKDIAKEHKLKEDSEQFKGLITDAINRFTKWDELERKKAEKKQKKKK